MERLKRFYTHFQWHMKPDDDKAVKRFENISEFFETLLSKRDLVPRAGTVRIIDLAAGTGIAGVALGKAFEKNGFEVDLLITDIRDDDLRYASVWKEISGFKGNLETRVLNVFDIEGLSDVFDIAVLWGLTTPHFSPDELVYFFKAVRNKITNALFLEETDRVYKIFYSGYRDVLKEDDILSIHSGYDRKTGMFLRDFYTLPDFKEIATMKIRFWDTPVVSAMCRVIFKDVEVVWKFEHRFENVEDVLICRI